MARPQNASGTPAQPSGASGTTGATGASGVGAAAAPPTSEQAQPQVAQQHTTQPASGPSGEAGSESVGLVGPRGVLLPHPMTPMRWGAGMPWTGTHMTAEMAAERSPINPYNASVLPLNPGGWTNPSPTEFWFFDATRAAIYARSRLNQNQG